MAKGSGRMPLTLESHYGEMRATPPSQLGSKMSALGHEQTSRRVRVMSVIPLKADIRQREWHVR